MNRRERKLWNRRFLALFLALLMVVGVAVPNSSSINTYAAETSQAAESAQETAEAESSGVESPAEAPSTEESLETQATEPESTVPESSSEEESTEAEESQEVVGESAVEPEESQEGLNVQEETTAANSGSAQLSLSASISTPHDGYVISGEDMSLDVSFTVPPLAEGGDYKAPILTITLPQGVTVNPDEIRSDAVESCELRPLGGTNFLIISLKPSLTAGQAHEISVPVHTENFVLEDGESLQFPIDFQATPASGKPVENHVTVSAAVQASDGWRLDKAVETQDGKTVIDRVTGDDNKEYFEVDYTLDVINQASAQDPAEGEAEGYVANRTGRLDFADNNGDGKADFLLVDNLPDNTPEGGGATVVSVSTKGRGVLTEGTDYQVVTNAAGEATAIQIYALDSLDDPQGQNQYLYNGAPVDTQYTVTLRYPVEAYQVPADVVLEPWVLKNTAELTYTLIGENEVRKNDAAEIQLGEYDGNVKSVDLTVEKLVQIGGQTFSLGEGGYGSASFALFRDAQGTQVANDIHAQPIGNVTETNQDGQVVFDELLVGRTYYLEEVSAPAGFAKAFEGRLAITVDADGNVTAAAASGVTVSPSGEITVTNTADSVGSLEFYKYGKSSVGETSPLEGVTFTLTSKEDGQRVYTAVSDENGRVYFPAVLAGDYTLAETGLPDNLKNSYVLAASRDVTVTANQLNRPVWTDEGSTPEKPVFLNTSPYGRLTLVKTSKFPDAQGETLYLGGAQFALYQDEDCTEAALDSTGKPVTLTTENNTGRASSGQIPEGNYWLKEERAPEGYALLEDPVPVTITANQTTELLDEIQNQPLLPLSINKVGVLSDGENQSIFEQPLEGVEFEIYDSAEGGKLLATLVTKLDATGNAVTVDKETGKPFMVAPGTYWYQETETPDGFTPIEGRQPVTVDNGQTETKVVNTTLYGQIKVIKVDASAPDKGLAGATFEVYNKADCTGTPVDTFTTGENGEGLSKLLPVGTYWLKETKAPDGYTVMTSVIAGVDGTGMGTETGSGLTVSENQQTTVTVENAQQVGVRVVKQDSITGTKLEGARFTLYLDKNCRQVKETKSTDANGAAVFSGLTANTTYYIKENSAPSGYTADTEKVYEVTTPSAAAAEKIVEVTVENHRLGKLVIEKTTTMDAEGGQGTPMANVPFRLYQAVEDANGSYTFGGAKYSQGAPVTDKAGMTNGVATTDAAGKASIDGLEPGLYILVEEEQEGYPAWSAILQVVVGQNQGEGYPSAPTPVVNTPDEGKFQIQKVSSLNEATGLEATFDIYDQNNKKVGTIKTDGNGKGVSGWLAPGTYTLKETGVEDGYAQSDATWTVTVTAGKTDQTYVTTPIANNPVGKLVIQKSAIMDGNTTPYEGAVFSLYKVVSDTEDDYAPGVEAAYTGTSTADGQVTIDNIVPGEYWLVESAIANYAGFTPDQITIQPGQNRTDLGGQEVAAMEITNTPSMGKVQIQKVDSVTRQGLAGAEFSLYPETEKTSGNTTMEDSQRDYSSTASYTLTTGNDGTVTSDWITPGRYKVVETKTPANYQESDTAYYITVTAAQTNKVLYEKPVPNVPQGKISISKTARFSVVGADGNTEAGQGAEYTRYPLTGAAFTIYRKTADNTNPDGTCNTEALKAEDIATTLDLTDASSGTTGYLDTGEYWVVETTTPANYVAAAPVPVTVTAGQTVAANNHAGDGLDPSIDNEPNLGKLRLFKYLRNTGALLDGAEFELYRVDNTNGTEYTLDDGKVVKLVKVQASNSAGDDAYKMESGTNGDGSAVTIDIEPGTYYLRETSLEKAWAAYDQTIPIENWHWEQEWTGPFTVVKGLETETTAIWNYYVVPGPGIKTGVLDEGGLEGAYFAAFETQEEAIDALSALDGLKVGKTFNGWTSLAELKTALATTEGQESFKKATGAVDIAVSGADGTFSFQNLAPAREYYVMEIAAPEGYELPTEITMQGDDVIVKVTTEAGGGFKEELEFQDVAMGRLQVVKYTTLSGQHYVVEGVTINVYRAERNDTSGKFADGDTKYDYKDTDEKGNPLPIATGTTDENGLYTSVLLPAGVYIVQEDRENLPDLVKGPADGETGYRIVVVEQKEDKEADIFVNDKYASIDDADGTNGFHNEAAYGKFQIAKVSSLDKNEAVSATFEVYRDQAFGTSEEPTTINKDDPVKREDGSVYTITTTTDLNNPAESDFLAPGVYWLVETSVTGEYTVNPEPISVVVPSGSIDTALVKEPVTNVPQGQLVIQKVGVENGNRQVALAGVTFDLYHKTIDNTNGNTVNWDKLKTEQPVPKDITTDENGQVTVTGLDAGEYWLIETSVGPNVNYQLGDPAYAAAVEIKPGQSTSLTGTEAIENHINAGRFALTKTFTGTGAADSDTATFKVEKQVTGQDGQVSYEEKVLRVWDEAAGQVKYEAYTFTVSNGQAYTSQYLEPGTYRITETGTSTGDYQLAASFLVTIEAGETTTSTESTGTGISSGNGITLTNTKLGSLTVEKIGEFQDERLENLAGVTFKLYPYDAAVNGDWKNDFNLETDLDSLTPVTGKVNGQDTTEFVTGENGQVTVTHIVPGTYWLVETDLGSHDDKGKYTLDGVKPDLVQITSGETTALTGESAVVNTTRYGKLQITKTDYQSGAPLEGAVFSIHQTAGASDTSLGTIRTGADGKALSGLLPAGEYYLKEITEPEGYQAVETIYGPYQVESDQIAGEGTAITIANRKEFTIQVTKVDEKDGAKLLDGAVFALYDDRTKAEEDQKTGVTTNALATGETKKGQVSFTVTIADNSKHAESSQTFYLVEVTPPAGYAKNTVIREVKVAYNTGAEPVTVTNQALGTIELQKNVEWDGRTQGLEGVVFQFYPVSGKGVEHGKDDQPADTQTTDAQGHLTTNPLKAGWYQVVEYSTPQGYQAETLSYWVEVKNQTVNQELVADPVENTPIQGNFRLEKVAGDGTTALGGAVFEFYKKDASGQYQLVDGTNTFRVDLSGGKAIYTSGMLDPGDYMVKESSAPSQDGVQYSVSGEEIQFTIRAGHTVDLTGANAVKNYPQMSITLTKTGDAQNGSPVLAGAVFQLYTDAAATQPLKDPVTTNENGVATWTGIDPGTYYIKEVTAPEGYALSDEVRKVTVPESAATSNANGALTVDAGSWVDAADEGRLLIRKTDADGTQMLSGAQFDIYGADASGQYTVKMSEQPLTTGGDGLALSGLLPAEAGGTTYRVVEVKAPDGYTLDGTFTELTQDVVVYPIHSPQYQVQGVSQNVVTFVNKTVGSIGSFNPDIQKEISDDNEAYTTDTVSAEESLLMEPYTVNFKVSGLADGTNDLPADSFMVTDDNITLYNRNSSTDGTSTPYVAKAAEEGDYTIDQVVVAPASNGDAGQLVTAEVRYRTFGSEDWQTAASGLTLDQARTVDLTGKNAVGIRIVYGNVGKGFTAEEGFTMQVTFAKREGSLIGSDIPEVRRITNQAVLDWSYTYLASDGTQVPVSGSQESNTVEALIPTANRLLPQVQLTNTVINSGSGNVFYTGEELDFQVKAVNVQNQEGNAPDFRQPVIAVDLPGYTTLDADTGFMVYQTRRINGEVQHVALTEGQDYTVEAVEVPAVESIQKGQLIYSETETTTRYIFRFSEDIVLAPDTVDGANSSLTIGYSASIDYDKPSGQINLYSPAYLSSLYQLPASLENPLGLSFEGYQVSTQENEELDDALGTDLEYLNQPVGVTVLNSQRTELVKTVSAQKDTGYTTSQVNVYPNENVYYNLTLYNNSTSSLTSARFVDILPFNGDTNVFRAGGITDRLTTIPNGEEYEEMLLQAVTPEDGYATVYYFVEADSLANSWNRDNRLTFTAEEELPMLYQVEGGIWNYAGNTGGYWTTEKPADMSLVTAVGVEVTFPEGDYLQPGETYTVNLEMKTPGYAAEDISLYADAVMANTSAMAVVRSDDTEINPTRDIVEPNKVLVGLSLPTGSIGDTAWYDLNNNGLQDDGEAAAAANITVELYQTTLTNYNGTIYRSEETRIAATTTDGQGKYLFTDLPCNYLASGADAGSTNPDDYVGDTIYYYRVRFSVPEDHAATIRYNGGEEPGAAYETDSNIDTNGWTDYLTLSILNEEVDGRNVITGEDNLTVDAGYVVSVSLGDRVWIDENHDGIQGSEEPGLEGALVKLYRVDSADDQVEEGDEPIETTMTDADGYYLFDQLPQGYYVVEFDIRALTTDGYTYQYAFTDPDVNSTSVFSPDDSDAIYDVDSNNRVKRTQVIPLTFEENGEIFQDGNKTDRTWDAGVWAYSALGGYVFEDTNYTDLQDIDTEQMDGPLPGTLVQLYRVINGIREAEPIREATVGEDGRYFFDELEAGQYQVYFRFPDGYTAVDSADGEKTPDTNLSDTNDSDCCVFVDGNYQNGYTEVITLGYNTVDETWDAGANKLGALGDYVWFDADKDGIQDEGEEPIAGVTVILQYRMGDSDTWKLYPGGTTTTDAEGRYQFTGLPGGDDYDIQYRVVFNFEDPTVTITTPNAGTDSAVDSDALGFYVSGLGYVTTTIFLGYGETDLTWDAGVIVSTCGMGDYVWHDANRNGIQDEGEDGVAGIPVVLERNLSGQLDNEADWEVVGTTTTDDNGFYRFLDLTAGYYRVRFQISDPYIVTLNNQGEGEDSYQYDSDASMAIGGDWYRSRIFYLEDDQYDWTWDAGLYLESDIPTVVIEQHVPGSTGTTKTGDEQRLWPWIAVGTVALAAAGVTVFEKKRRKSKS